MLPTIFDFPVKPHVRKYLNEHLGTGVYTLSPSDRFGKLMFHLLRRQLRGKSWVQASTEGCTSVLQVDLRNFPARQYGLTELTAYTIYQFNDDVDDLLKRELRTWVKNFLNCKTTIRDIILDFMAAYDLTEEDIQFETLRKDVQRNVKLAPLKKRRAKGEKTVVKMSRKTAGLSQETAELSQEPAGLSRYASIRSLRQQLSADAFPRS